MKLSTVVFLLLSLELQNGGVVVNKESPFPRGAVHREIAESSPYVKLTISQTGPQPGYSQKYGMLAILTNLTAHTVTYVNPRLIYEIHDRKTGKLAPTAPAACSVLFFLDCYQPYLPFGGGVPSSGPPKDIVAPHSSITIQNISFLDGEYILTSGQYTVVGIYCAKEREGPECFKSNKIILTVP